MEITNTDISELATKAGLKLTISDTYFEIKHQLNWRDKSILGIILIACGGIFLTYAPFVKRADIVSKTIGIAVGLILCALAAVAIIRQLTDYIKISGKQITFRHNFRFGLVPIDNYLKIIMKSEVLKVRRSDFIIITHYLQSPDKEIPVLTFQMDNKDAEHAFKLGNQITTIINLNLKKLSNS